MSFDHATASGQPERTNLATGHMSVRQASVLAISSFFPAVGLATAPVLIAGVAGNGAWLSVLISAVVIMCVGHCITVFAKRFVVTGSLYSYMSHVFGNWAKAITAASLGIGYVIALLTVLLPFGLYFGSFMVTMGWPWWITTGGQLTLYAIAMFITLMITYRGLDASVRTGLILLVVSLPFMIVILIAIMVQDGVQLQQQLSLSGTSFSGISAGALLGFAFLLAFEGSTALAAETQNPKRNVPIVIMSVPVVLGVLYTLGTLIQVPALEKATDALAAGISPPAALAMGTGVAFLAKIIDLVLAVAIFATLIGFMNYGSRIWATMAQDGLLPSRLADVHPRFRSPTKAIVTLGVTVLAATIVLVMISGGTPLKVYELGATLLTYFWVPPYILICIGAIKVLRKERTSNPFVVISAVVGIAAFLWLFISTLIFPGAPPYDVLPYVYLGIIALGTAAFAMTIRGFGKRKVDVRDPQDDNQVTR